jgi:hypothetical protein
MEKVIIQVNRDMRIVVYPQGGLDIESHVDGPGWILANDALITDAEVSIVLSKAARAIGIADQKICD